MKRYVVIALLFLLTSCGIVPTRLFQKSVPPPLEKSGKAKESDRQAAELLTHGKIDPPSLQMVATELSNSLGKPEKALPSATPEQINRSAERLLVIMAENMVQMQKQIDAQNKFLAKYAGTKLEGTGFDLVGPGMATIIIGLIVLGVICPPAMTVIFFVLRRTKAALGTVVNGIEDAAKSDELKESVAAVKKHVGERMKANKQPTSVLKAAITDLKQ